MKKILGLSAIIKNTNEIWDKILSEQEGTYPQRFLEQLPSANLELYRMQKISTANYMFRHHLETPIIDDENSKKGKCFVNIRSIGALFSFKPFKVKIDCLGNIKLLLS